MKNKDFGAYLKVLRNENRFTLEELGKKIGLSKPYLSHIENGKRGIPSPEILEKLARALNTPYSTLMEKAGYIGLTEQWLKDMKKDFPGLLDAAELFENTEEFTDYLFSELNKFAYMDINRFKDEYLLPFHYITLSFGVPIEVIELTPRKFIDKTKLLTKEQRMGIVYGFLYNLNTQQDTPILEINSFLDMPGITYNGELISDTHRQQIKEMLRILFMTIKKGGSENG